jgi:hypothetical protein
MAHEVNAAKTPQFKALPLSHTVPVIHMRQVALA